MSRQPPAQAVRATSNVENTTARRPSTGSRQTREELRRMAVTPLLEVTDLAVRFGSISAVSSVSFSVRKGDVVGVVGESGAGKSATAKAIVGLLPPSAAISGSVRFRAQELVGAPVAQLRRVRGASIGYVFQDALTALDPVRTVGAQLAEALRVHRPVSRREALRTAGDLLGELMIAKPARCLDSYPHQLSGGMRQRVVIASALIADPELIIADELTSALDVTVQRRVLDLLMKVCGDRGAAVILITHDLGVVAQTCDEVVVLYGGVVVERSDVFGLFDEPRHPYTRALLASLPRIGDDQPFTSIPGTAVQVIGDLTSCPFAPRCSVATERCCAELPGEEWTDQRSVRCFHPLRESA